jgi:hypothetical protein
MRRLGSLCDYRWHQNLRRLHDQCGILLGRVRDYVARGLRLVNINVLALRLNDIRVVGVRLVSIEVLGLPLADIGILGLQLLGLRLLGDRRHDRTCTSCELPGARNQQRADGHVELGMRAKRNPRFEFAL